MPLPTPNEGEKQSDFISRCISFETKASPGRDAKQVQAMCYTAYRRAKGVKASEGEMPNLKYAMFADNEGYEKIDVKLSTIRLWKKQILRYGTWKHPENPEIEFEITPVVLGQIVNNFNAGIPVEAPVTATHSDDPSKKKGRVKSFVVGEQGLYAIMSVDDTTLNENISSLEKAPDVSCWLDLNYMHKETGERVGAVVKHVALVNHPYIEGMEGFEAMLSEAGDDKDYMPLVFLSEKKIKEETVMTKDEMIAKLKAEHEVDVAALLTEAKELATLQTKIEKGEYIPKSDAKVTLSDELAKKIREKLELSEDTDIDVASVLEKLLAKDATEATKLSEAVENSNKEIKSLKDEIEKGKAEKEVSVLLSSGFLFPKEQKSYEKLYTSDKETFDALVSARKETGKVVKLGEDGTSGGGLEGDKESKEDALKRNKEAAKEEGYIA